MFFKASNEMCKERKNQEEKNKCLKNRNFFGGSISKWKNNVKSCAFRELWKYNNIDGSTNYIDGRPHTEQAWRKQKIKTIGSCYNFNLETGKISNIFNFRNDKVEPVVSSK